MIRRPPRSTLFPSRRSSDLNRLATLFGLLAVMFASSAGGSAGGTAPEEALATAGGGGSPAATVPAVAKARSEEHTSELQSHSDLVCRLLLEKKKKKSTQLQL